MVSTIYLPEKAKYLFLNPYGRYPIFVPYYCIMKHGLTRKTLFPIILCLLFWASSQAQYIWPGDVNDNGIVNTIDLLYCSIAKDSTGAARDEVSTDWDAYPVSEEWAQYFGDGTNFAYADCNGDGTADDDDFDVLQEHYGFTHGEVIPDQYQTGNPATDPTLLLEALTPAVDPGGTVEILLSLGDASHPVNNFYGIVFTLNFDPEPVALDNGNNHNNFRLEFTENSWVKGSGSDKAAIFMKVDYEEGEADVAILRKNIGITSGFGEIGKFIIVMEDVVFFEEETLPIFIDKIKMIDPYMNEYPVAPSAIDILLNGGGDDDDDDDDGGSYRGLVQSTEIGPEMVLYSDGKGKQFRIENNNQNIQIEKVEIIGKHQQKINVKINSRTENGKQKILINAPEEKGQQLKIITSEGIIYHSFNK